MPSTLSGGLCTDKPMNSASAEIEVVMATWNGSRFVEEQLDSLFSQSFRDFRLTVRDDASTDSTLEIVEKYRSRYPDRIVVQRNHARMGACATFGLLLQHSDASYVAFCDQDDVWRNDKLDISFRAMQTVERKYGINTPVLVFSDMALMEEDRTVIAPSLWKMAHVNPARSTLGTMLAQNLVSGCTALFSKSKSQLDSEEDTRYQARRPCTMLGWAWWLPLLEYCILCTKRQFSIASTHRRDTMGAGRGLETLRRRVSTFDWRSAVFR